MALAPGFPLLLALSFLLQLPDWSRGAPADTHSVCYKFSIRFNEEQWCEVQGYLNERNLLFHYNCANLKVLAAPGLNITEDWQTLKDIGDKLRKLMKYVEPGAHKPKDPVTLQANMCCEMAAGGGSRGYWQLGFDEKILLSFEPKKGWTKVVPGARLKEEEWNEDMDENVASFFKKTSQGDSQTTMTTATSTSQATDSAALRLSLWILVPGLILPGICARRSCHFISYSISGPVSVDDHPHSGSPRAHFSWC
ncbi:PREDICTED: NKG2D ligand 2-like [Elephantulus edwardii]|uniref:NKG2D ligand 2-like n=1 Tax=Elephantulus edwardii TaxID=28737 RepID=UPI0003F0BB30|nr:PREDICTED: NKG2D ligand 2-like [Elephantulus edwardii]